MDLTKILLLVLCINLMLYVGGVRTFDGDIVSFTLKTSGSIEDGNFTVHNLRENITGMIPETPETAEAQTGDTGGWNLIDGLYMGWSIILFILNILTAPLGIFLSVPELPPVITLLFGLPVAVLFIIAGVYFIRSGK